ncbi:chemoreceptor glutamine deamidase CheD [soil metagenome]|nr:chemotaxis protein CheD [Gemmatimonadota bacterium]
MTLHEISVGVSRHAIGYPDDTLVAVGLGSCVVIILSDASAHVAGMAHVLLPDPSVSRDASNPYKFATSAVPALVADLTAAGAVARRLEARLVGGASMFAALMTTSSMNMGERNLAAVHDSLRTERIPIHAEEVGGGWGRSVRFDVAANRARVSSVYRADVYL